MALATVPWILACILKVKLIDAATNKPVIKVVRQGEGKDLNNESTPMAFENIKQVIDDMATDATMFDVNKSSSRRAIVRWRAQYRFLLAIKFNTT